MVLLLVQLFEKVLYILSQKFFAWHAIALEILGEVVGKTTELT